MRENINPSEKIKKILMSHPAKNCFLISNFPYLNTIWNTTIAIVVFTLHPRLDIVNEPVRPLLFTISSSLLYQGKVFL